MTYGDFSLRFLVDENLENYMAIHNWLTGLGFPETHTHNIEILPQIMMDIEDFNEQFSDGSLTYPE